MPNINLSSLNPTDLRIHECIKNAAVHHSAISITQAAELCGCSVSKISKFSKKVGFATYKEYMNYIYGRQLPTPKSQTELDRLRDFIDQFDLSLIDDFLNILLKHERIILFGYGPSALCTQYFEYKLRIVTDKVVFAVPDETSAMQLINDKSLFIIFTTTGLFKSFEQINDYARTQNCEVLILMEEFHAAMLEHFDHVMILSNTRQPGDLPYEKSRSIFFIFIEEVIRRLMLLRKEAAEDK
ncbi:MAG: MurR/RpiR family transcriptional regulator [Lachnospiraceae bacterium]